MGRRVWQVIATALVSVVLLAGCSGGGSSGELQADSGGGDHDTGAAVGPDGSMIACGAKSTLCAIGGVCKSGADCASTVCQDDLCKDASCGDLQMDGMETDVDCGGMTCGTCGTGKKCGVAADCASNVCKAGVCQAPTSTDTFKNDSETDVDCGGALLANGQHNPDSDGAPVCKVGKGCLIGSDCADGVCATGPVLVDNLDAGLEAAAKADAGAGKLTCQPATAQDGVKNSTETDVDCGGHFLMDGSVNPASDGAPTCAATKACVLKTDCQSDVCTAGICQSPAANDTVQNDSETDVDCGGGFLAGGAVNSASDGAKPCADTLKCVLGTDCVNLVCATGSVGSSGSTDGKPIDCPAGQSCTCQPASPTDGVKNDSETDIDCGGALLVDGTTNPASDGAPVCQFAATPAPGCLLGLDCNAGVCNDGVQNVPNCPVGSTCTCQPPSTDDGVKNGGETDIDCGGADTVPGSDGAAPCPTGDVCVAGSDCDSLVCKPNFTCAAPSPTDGITNGDETDVDCGGATTVGSDAAPKCIDQKMCLLDADCLSGTCTAITANAIQRCVGAPSCKGAYDPAPITDISRHAGTVPSNDPMDEAAGVANANGVGQSAGLDTCGRGESTDAASLQTHESCCKSLLVPNYQTCTTTANCAVGATCVAGQCQVRMDKYEVTAGRMRQFIESVNAAQVKNGEAGYNIQEWVNAQLTGNGGNPTAIGAVLKTQIPTAGDATNVVPLYPVGDVGGLVTSNWQSVVVQLGATTMDEGYPSDAQGCFSGPGAYGASTYWFSDAELSSEVGSPPRPFPRDYYDIKSMNCTPYWMAAAFCAWDGGRLPNYQETNAIYPSNTGNGGGPWAAGALPVIWSAMYDPDPAGVNPPPYQNDLDVYAANYTPAKLITDFTVNYHNANVGASSDQGLFYFYPNWITNNPDTGPLSAMNMDPWPDTLSGGTDGSPYISAPGRFTLDVTNTKSPGTTEGWYDVGANMMEYQSAQSLTGNLTGAFCDTTSHTTQASNGGNCSSNGYNCGRTDQDNGVAECGILRTAVALPGIAWEGGSWEGHGIENGANGAYNEPMQSQYGKAGFRCVRPIEPTQ
jgi:hypothetical protein